MTMGSIRASHEDTAQSVIQTSAAEDCVKVGSLCGDTQIPLIRLTRALSTRKREETHDTVCKRPEAQQSLPIKAPCKP